MRRFLPLLLVAVLGLSAGCGPSVVQFGGKPRPKFYQRVISLSPSTTELLVATQTMNAPRFAGRTAYDNYPKGQLNGVPIIASVKPDYEKIATIRPDLVAYDADLYSADDVEKIKKIGGDLFVMDATNLDGYIKELYAMSALVGGETYISDYVDKIMQAKAAAAGGTVRPKVAIVMPGQGGQHMIAGTDSFIADVVRASGGDPVGPKATKFVPLDDEAFIGLNPDWIVTSGDPTPLQQDPKLKPVKAISSKHLVPINPDILLRRGSRVDTLITAIHDVISK